MRNVQEVKDQIFWIGANDQRLERFENLFPLPNGVSYNSFVIKDEKIALLDTADAAVAHIFLQNLENVLGDRDLDYLVVNHMEPDHCALIEEVIKRYPKVQIVGNRISFQLIRQFYPEDLEDHFYEVKEGDTLSLGKHTLQFVFAPMVHWPEVMMTYEQKEKILFSADAFGSFGAISGNIFADQSDFEKNFLEESRRYYTNIVGKFGVQVQAVLKKAANLDIEMIAPLHGPIWRENLDEILEKYQLWSTYTPEEQSVVIFYATMYGNTENVVEILASKLSEKGIRNIRTYDVSKTHPSYLISEAFRSSNIVFASPTYNLGLFYAMDNLMEEMSRLLIQKRKVSLIGNGSWSPTSIKNMEEKLLKMKDMEMVGEPLQIISTLKEVQLEELDILADAIKKSL